MFRFQAQKRTVGPDDGAACHAHAGAVAQSLLFFALLYLYLWRIVEPHLLFHGAGTITDFPSFYQGWEFAREHLVYPGGLTLYLAAFLSQLFYYSWLGALVVTLQAWATYLCVARLLDGANLSRWRIVGYIPAVLLAVLYGRYTWHFPTTLTLSIALACACGYLVLAHRQASPAARLITFAILSLACYLVVGGASLLFALLCALYEWQTVRGWRLTGAYTAIGAILPYVIGVLAFGVSLDDAYTRLLPVSGRVLHYVERRRLLVVVCALYLLVPLVIASGLVWKRFRLRRNPLGDSARRAMRKERPDGRTGSFAVAIRRYWANPTLRWTAQTLLLIGVGAGIACASLDQKQKTRFAVDYYAFHGMWPKVLAEGRKNPNNRYVMHAVDRALYHTGKLGDEMFRWPQDPAYLFLIGTGRDWVHWQSFNVHLDLGLLNLAEHSLTESLERLGERPMILQRLTLIHLVKGNLGTARIYLGALSKTLFHRQWARHYLALLDSDPGLSTDLTVQHLRSIALEQDRPLLGVSKEMLLLALLDKNGRNRMAYEYLMAWYLLNKQLPKFKKQTERLGEMGYSELPRHFEEAILLYVYGTKQPLSLGGYQPRARLQEQIGHLLEILDRHKGNKQAALPELAKYHRDTYFFYYLYAQPGKVE